MKTILSLLFALTLGTAFGQFIPQQMGYNPDENGDALIGVNDLQGLLSLYGQPFDNGDSVVVTTLTFPDDYGDDYAENGQVPVLYIEEDTDFLYIHQTEDQEVFFYLPQGPGFKVLQVFISTEIENFATMFFLTNESASFAYGSGFHVQPYQPLHMAFIRGHNGTWYQDGRN